LNSGVFHSKPEQKTKAGFWICSKDYGNHSFWEFNMLQKLFLVLALFAGMAQAQEFEDTDKTLSPYFFVKSDDPNLDQLPLKSTSAEVNIAGVIADVKVTQVYRNEGKRPLEASYVFPASTRAAVYGMKMTIGDRTVVAKIGKREEARREYQKALEEGRSASLLEQQRPNVFQMNVGNLLPGDEIKVELSYTELLVPSEGVYEFVYPTVVGPRYSNQPEATAPANDRWIKNPYFKQGQAPSYTFDITTNLTAGVPIQEALCASHKVNVSYDGPARATFKLDDAEKLGGNRDYILKYRLAGGQIASGMLTYEHQDENFFLLMMQPPQRVNTNQIPPREYIFIVDVSGSMHGFPLEISKKLLRELIGNLRPADHFNVLLFSGGSSVMAEKSLAATPENIKRALAVIEEQQGGGGTELLPALQRAFALPRALGSSRTVVIATDGYVSVEAEAFDLIRQKLGEANLFAFGIGSSVNRHLLEGMARAGMGEPFIITRPDEAPAEAEKFRRYIQTPVLTRVRVDFGEFSAYAIEPPAIPDVLAERPVIVFGKWRGPAKGTIKLSGLTGEESYTANIQVSAAQSSPANSALRYLWARHRIAVLSDYNAVHNDPDRVNEVTNLGLQYNLLTAYTSFVAVDSKVRKVDGQVTRVEQPLPLPQGVSDYAVGQPHMLAVQSAMPSGAALHRTAGFAGRSTELDAILAPEAEKKAGSVDLRLKSPARRQDAGTSEIKVSKIVAGEAVSAESLSKAIELYRAEMKACYTQALQLQPGLRGRLVVKYVIDARGHITAIQIVSDALRNQSLTTCLTQKMKAWQIVGVKNRGEATVTFEFMP
jgi:Ca-activated chloride channel family protein